MALTPTSVNAILTRKGIDVTVRTFPSSTFDSDTNKTTLGTAVDYTIKAAAPYRNRSGFKTDELITSGKGKTIFANLDLQFTVAAGLVMIIRGDEWSVIGFTPIGDNTGIIAYECDIETGS
ncbi:hypothetical protein LCGC14_0425790 [marine sediment metagenome]|uniref:Uncharacterized protein n=1 Tax=marine sediment metagenome TaxID=412755 RepID=A0A0F9T7P6_9ZZZZ